MMTENRVIVIVSTIGVLIVAIGVGVVLADAPANGAADRAAVVSRSMTPSGTSIPSPMPTKPVEQAPAATGGFPGDGAWAVGREIARGTYRTDGGRSCHWARLTGTPGGPWSLDTPTTRRGPQIAVLGETDLTFATRGCAPWRRVR